MGRSHGRSQTTVPLPFRYREVSLSSGALSQLTCVTRCLWCSCSPQLQLWMWTGRATTHLPLVAQTCVFMSVNWDRTDPSRHSRDTQSVLLSHLPHSISLWFHMVPSIFSSKSWCCIDQRGCRTAASGHDSWHTRVMSLHYTCAHSNRWSALWLFVL